VTTPKDRHGAEIVKRNLTEYRRTRVAGLLLSGIALADIAQILGVGQHTIKSDEKAIRAAWIQARLDAYERYQAEELAKLRLLERAVMKGALEGKNFSVDRVLAIMDRRAKMLGLDAPTKHVTATIPADVVDALIAKELEMIDQRYT
jgi:hypothetical protein